GGGGRGGSHRRGGRRARGGGCDRRGDGRGARASVGRRCRQGGAPGRGGRGAATVHLSYDEADLPDLTGEQGWMWDVFAGTRPFLPTPQFQELRERHFDLLCPPTQTRPTVPPDGGVPTVEALATAMRAAFDGADVLCSPTMHTVAPPVPNGWGTPYDD